MNPDIFRGSDLISSYKFVKLNMEDFQKFLDVEGYYQTNNFHRCPIAVFTGLNFSNVSISSEWLYYTENTKGGHLYRSELPRWAIKLIKEVDSIKDSITNEQVKVILKKITG